MGRFCEHLCLTSSFQKHGTYFPALPRPGELSAVSGRRTPPPTAPNYPKIHAYARGER